MLRRLLSALLISALMMPGIVFADPAKAQEYYNSAALEYEKGNYQKAADLLYSAYAEDGNLIYVYNRILALQAAEEYDEALKELKVFENRMANDAEKRFEDIPQVKKQLEERVALQENKNNDTNNNTNNTSNQTNNDTVKDPGTTTPTKKKGPGIVAISLLAGGALVAGTGILISTGIFFGDSTEHEQSIDVINRLNAGAVTFAQYEAEMRAIWGTDNIDAATEAYDDATNTQKSQETLSIILMATGGALVVGGIVAWIVNVSGDDSGADNVPTSADRLQISPVVGPDGIGAALKFEF